MNLIDEIKKCVPISGVTITFSPTGGYVGGVKKIECFSREKIVFDCGAGGNVSVFGAELELTKLTAGDAGFKGKIKGVVFE